MTLTHEEWVAKQERRKERIRTTSCPFCQAAPGQPCLGKNGSPRQSLHMERNGNTRERGPRPQPQYPS